MHRVVITGIGVVAPSGIGKEEFWKNSAEGRSFIESDAEMKALGTRSKVVSRIRGFEPCRFFDRSEEIFLEDRFIQYGVASGILAIGDSHLHVEEENPIDIGCITSTAIGGTPTVAATWEKLTDRGAHPLRYEPLGPDFAHATCSNYPSAELMRRFGFKGISTALSTGCTAGLDALGLCFEVVSSGDAKVMLAGASEAPLANISYATLDAIGALAIGDGEPSKASRPFDANRAGFVLGEGAAVLVLEEIEHAVARGAHIYAEVLSYASVSNAYHMSDLPPNGTPMVRVIEAVLKRSGIDPTEIGYINAHGSSTPQNDLFETNAYKEVFGKQAYHIPISSTKSMIGHSLSAASLMGVSAALGAIEQSIIPPTANYEVRDPECDLDYVPNVCRHADVRAALVTASGFGGIHSAALFRKVSG
jgi:3-oxoacyl-(acyl-carrier-protein) synthase